MKRIIVFILLTVSLLLVNNAFAAKVQNVELSYRDGFTIARIDVDGIVRYSHQTEIAKDGKPYRVIVDVLSATHELGTKNFTKLPKCPVHTIRTSQFSVNPEKVVRLVFDMDAERIYRIDSDKKSITITFSDKGTKSFNTWASAQFIKKQKGTQTKKAVSSKSTVLSSVPNQKSTKSVQQINNKINEDRMLSLRGANNTVADTKKKTVSSKATVTQKETVKKPAAKSPMKASGKTEVFGPTVDYAALQKEVKEQQEQKKKIVAKTAVKPTVKKEEKASKPKVIADAKVKKTVVASAPVLKKSSAKVETPKKQPVKTVAKVDKPARKAATKPKAKKETVTVAKKQDKKSTTTSRFRRSPAKSKKIKGTMVAEFPKRLVIKYKSRKYRDPFETLINENKNYNNPIEKKVPNVEGLKLVGIIESEGEGNRALFEDNSGYGYILKTGDKVRKGYVLRVNSDRVYFQIFEYGWSRTVSLTLES